MRSEHKTAVVLLVVPLETTFYVEFLLYRLHRISNVGPGLIFGGIFGILCIWDLYSEEYLAFVWGAYIQNLIVLCKCALV